MFQKISSFHAAAVSSFHAAAVSSFHAAAVSSFHAAVSSFHAAAVSCDGISFMHGPFAHAELALDRRKKKKKRRDATQMRLRNRSSVEALLPEQWLKLGESDFPVRREHRSVWGTHIPYIYINIFPVQW